MRVIPYPSQPGYPATLATLATLATPVPLSRQDYGVLASLLQLVFPEPPNNSNSFFDERSY